MLTRLLKLIGAAALGWSMLSTATPAFAQEAGKDPVTLRVGTFGGSWREAIEQHVGEKLKEQGIVIEYVLGNPAENLSKVIAARGKPPIDVMEIGPAERIAMIRHEFLEPVPQDLVPNLASIPQGIVEEMMVPHLIIQNGIVYNVDWFEKEGIEAPQSYEDLINPQLAGKVAFPDVTNTQHWTAVSALAKTAGGEEGDPQAGFDRVVEMQPQYFFSAASELAQKFSLGDVVAAPWHAGWGVRLDRSGQNVAFVHPQIGEQKGAMEYNYLGIVKGSANVEAAAAFINAFLDAQSQADFARAVGAVPVNIEARKILSSEEELARFMMLDDAAIEAAYTVDWEKIDQEKWRATWSRTIGK